jgi:hypothetical protein
MSTINIIDAQDPANSHNVSHITTVSHQKSDLSQYLKQRLHKKTRELSEYDHQQLDLITQFGPTSSTAAING